MPKEKKVHLLATFSFKGKTFATTICAVDGTDPRATTDPDEVTCNRCIAQIGYATGDQRWRKLQMQSPSGWFAVGAKT